jgi:hypothetical protein
VRRTGNAGGAAEPDAGGVGVAGGGVTGVAGVVGVVGVFDGVVDVGKTIVGPSD